MMYDMEIIRSRRRTLGLEITRDGRVVVRAPFGVSEEQIGKFVASKQGWLEKHLADFARAEPLPPMTSEEIRALAEAALEDIPRRVEKFAPLAGVRVGRITIRNQVCRWGSCSPKGNLNFNCLLMLCPEEVRDYVVVRELCHRKQMNHSPAFWAEVGRILPEYKEQYRWLKENGSRLIRRLER